MLFQVNNKYEQDHVHPRNAIWAKLGIILGLHDMVKYLKSDEIIRILRTLDYIKFFQ